MARHIMAVCVVCLLCADRLPCQQHFEDLLPADGAQQNIEYQRLNAKVFQHTDVPRNPTAVATLESMASKHARSSRRSVYSDTSKTDEHNSENDLEHLLHRRRKRHASHSHPSDIVQRRPEITEDFMQRIFEEYGQGNGVITMTQFQHMLQQLGLHQLVQHKSIVMKDDGNARNDSETCISDKKLVLHVQQHDLSSALANNHDHDHDHDHDKLLNCSMHFNETSPSPCAKNGSLVHKSNNYTLNDMDMFNVCPVLLYQLTSALEAKRTGCIDASVLADIEKYEAIELGIEKEEIIYVWIYAFISVFACGILGLVGVAIIPFMDSRYYKHIIQFLVSLAVGTMTGDALLHLLPHSLAGQTETNMIFKGFTCMGGIIFFYITEHGLTMISEWRKRIAKQETKKPSGAKVVRDPDSAIPNSVPGDKLCKSKYSSYPYCYDEIAMDTKNDIHLPSGRNSFNHADALNEMTNNERKRNGRSDVDGGEIAAAQSLLSTSHNNYSPMTDMNHHDHHQHHQQQLPLPDSNTISTDLDGNSLGDGLAVAVNGCGGGVVVGAANKEKDPHTDTVTVILREHESSHHGHSHRHGHVHSPPESLSAVAWMIIMGDGLHNFTDGMAIGAAFAENIAGGFSTSLAVFCHELPHELGDFAILMKAGMSVKSAVYYNLLTGVLSFIGMIVGIVFGQSQEAAQWMFAAAAGLFIYIALVDMMPELSAAHKSIEQFILQILGMSSGVMLMLLIAIYEGDLMNVFSTSPTAPVKHVH